MIQPSKMTHHRSTYKASDTTPKVKLSYLTRPPTSSNYEESPEDDENDFITNPFNKNNMIRQPNRDYDFRNQINSGQTAFDGIGQYPEDLKNLEQSLDDSISDELRNKLKDSLEIFKTLNLLDDEKRMDQIYKNSFAAADNMKYFYNLLLGSYQLKYKFFLEEWPHVQGWIAYVIGMVIFVGEDRLKQACTDNLKTLMKSEIPSVSLDDFEDVYDDIEEPVTKNMKQSNSKHPLYNTEIFKKYQNLFSIGTYNSICLPSIYAILNISSSNIEPIYKHMKNKGKVLTQALRYKFRIPMTALITKIDVKDVNSKIWPVARIEGFDDLKTVASSMIGLPVQNLSCGNTNGMIRKDIVTDTDFDYSPNDSKKGTMYINVGSFDFFKMTNNTGLNSVTGIIYNNNVYTLFNYKLDQKVKESCAALNKSKFQEYEKNMKLYKEEN